MPQKATIQRAQRDKRAGKSASTQAGEFVKDEIDRIRAGKHGAKNAKQAIAIGLSEARRAGVDIPDKRGSKARPTKRKATAKRAATKRAGSTATKRAGSAATSRRRSTAALRALKGLPRRAASHLALSRQAHRVARTRTKASRSAAARKGARTRAAG